MKENDYAIIKHEINKLKYIGMASINNRCRSNNINKQMDARAARCIRCIHY